MCLKFCASRFRALTGHNGIKVTCRGHTRAVQTGNLPQQPYKINRWYMCSVTATGILLGRPNTSETYYNHLGALAGQKDKQQVTGNK